jgi:hypothetical protein
VSDGTRLWYFAYGSNMQTATLRGRRGIEFARALPGRAAGWRLVLDKPPLVPVGEAYANILPDPEAAVPGVLYELGAADLAHVELTEGVQLGDYRRAAIRVEPLGRCGETLEAVTLVSDRRAPGLRPSRRYMACLIAGAEEHGLPADWIAFLRAVPADDETAEARRLRALLDPAPRKPEPGSR